MKYRDIFLIFNIVLSFRIYFDDSEDFMEVWLVL